MQDSVRLSFWVIMQIFDYGLLWSTQPWKVNTTKRKDFLESKMESVFPVLKYYANEVIKHAILFIYVFLLGRDTSSDGNKRSLHL